MSENRHDTRVEGGIDDPYYKAEPATRFPFTLDQFQEIAISYVERYESVLVSAHTSAGKTVVAEYACAVSMRNSQRIIYTSPIKALSNQKYREFKEKFEEEGDGTVGLMTGDNTINPDAPIVVMTTEILRSMIYRASEVLDEVAWVVFDEVHYMQDRDRGVVWEETIIILPPEIRMIFLSATLPNAREFADWVSSLRTQPCHVVHTDSRPTPLKHYGYPPSGDVMQSLVEMKTGAFKEKTFDELIARCREHRDGGQATRIEEDSVGQWKKADSLNAASKINDIQRLVHMFAKSDMLPAIIFCFGKRSAEMYASSIVEVMDLTTAEEKEQVDQVFDRVTQSLTEADQSLDAIDHIKRMAKNGVGVHHSGMLPLLKEVVEILFQNSTIRVLCATETFAMGLNMPARTVLFVAYRKFDGTENRCITSGEYIQMSGRAGRRGKDKKGNVILLLDEAMKKEECREILMGGATPLRSSFRLTYYTLLNLVQKIEGTQQSIDDIIRKSFNQFQYVRSIPELQRELESLQDRTENVTVDQQMLSHAISAKEKRRDLKELRRELVKAKLDYEHSFPLWSPGRLIEVKNYGVGVVIAPLAVLGIDDPYILDVGLAVREDIDPDEPEAADIRTDPECVMRIYPVFFDDVSEIYRITMELPSVLQTHEQKQDLLERFRRVMAEFPDNVPVARWVHEIEPNDPEIYRKLDQLVHLEREVMSLEPMDSGTDDSDERKIEEKIKLMAEVDEVKKKMENSTLISFQDEYRARMTVLGKLGHLNSDGVLTLKGRAACEIDAGDELVCAELLFNGTLKSINKNYLISFLSCLVPFTDKTKDKLTELPQLAAPFAALKQLAKHVADLSVESKVAIDPTVYMDTFHLCYANVMHAWETGSTFGDICKLSDIHEGTIIRSARRLAELIHQLASAATVMGDTDLVKTLAESNQILKRDIMFAASLYV